MIPVALIACILAMTIIGLFLSRRTASSEVLTLVEPRSEATGTPNSEALDRIRRGWSWPQFRSIRDLSELCGEGRSEPERMAIIRRNRLLSVLRGRLAARHSERDAGETRRRS